MTIEKQAVANLLGMFVGVHLADETLREMRERRSNYVEELARLRQMDLGDSPWVIYVNGTGIGLGILGGGKSFECMDVPVYQATRLRHSYAQGIIDYGKARGFGQTERFKALRILDIREAITTAIGVLDAHMKNIEDARRPAAEAVRDLERLLSETEPPEPDANKPTAPQERHSNDDKDRSQGERPAAPARGIPRGFA